MLTDEARQKRNEYQRKYKREHPEKAKQWYDNYWNRLAQRAVIIEGVTSNENRNETDSLGSEGSGTISRSEDKSSVH